MEDFKHKGPEHTEKFKAGRHRTYFFDVYSTRKGECYLTVTESKKRADGNGYERHKIFLYKEDLNRFLDMLTQSVNHVKDRMPDYDYDDFARRQIEWESQRDNNKAIVGNEDGDMEIMEANTEHTAVYVNAEEEKTHHIKPSQIPESQSLQESNHFVNEHIHTVTTDVSSSVNKTPDAHATEDLSW